MKYFITITLFSLFMIMNCDGTASNTISYGFDVEPIFRDNCFACHSSEKNSSANLNLSSYETLMYDTSDSGPVVIPKHPERSILIDKIASPTPMFGSQMPFNAEPLSNEDIRMIDIWIYRGAKDN
ncbi:MAG: c-type cytochrome domain-containing protein [Fidelibacterota bacterium]